MNHDPLDPQLPDEDLLAVSALLDGTATADDVARVDADPALRELLDVWRDQRTALADVAVPAQAREAALAAAMAAFDLLQAEHQTEHQTEGAAADAVDGIAAAPTPAPGNVIRFERRRRTYRLLTGVAAAVGVLFVGALVVGGLGSMGGSDEESTAIAPEAAAKSPLPDAARVADDPATPMMESAEAAPMGGADPTGEAGDAAFSTASPAATESAAASEVTEAPAATEAPAPENSADSISGAADLVVAITTPQALLDYANTQQPILPLPGLALPCVAEGDEAVGEVTYQGTPAVVVRDPQTGEVRALDLDAGCAVLATATP